MPAETKKERILAGIKARGWSVMDLYYKEACELREAGLIKVGTRYSTGGNRKLVWVAS